MAWTDRYVTADAGGGGDGSSGSPWTLAEAFSSAAAGDRVNVKTGSYSITSATTFSTSGTSSAPIWIRGYDTSIGDLDDKPLSQRTPGTDMPLVSMTSTGDITASGNFQYWSSIAFTTSVASKPPVYCRNSGGWWRRCRFEHSNASATTHAGRTDYSSEVCFFGCHFKHASGSYAACVVLTSSSRPSFYGCVFEGGDNCCDIQVATQVNFSSCIFKNSSSVALLAVNGVGAWGCTFYDSGSHAISITGTASVTYKVFIAGCYFHTVGGYAIHTSSSTPAYVSNNCFYSITSGQLSGIAETLQFDAATDSSDYFANAGSGDFTLGSSSNGYEDGPPGLFEKDGPTSYSDIGAVQHQGGVGGGGTTGRQGLHAIESGAV